MNMLAMDLKEIVLLWETSDKNLLIKNQIEIELRNRICSNLKYSREYFFDLCKLKNHAITVFFIPTSDAYKNYGPCLTFELLLDDEEMNEQFKNYSEHPKKNTSGVIKGAVSIKGNLTEEQISKARTLGFHTRDIYDTLHV